jgi:hypothetical protein
MDNYNKLMTTIRKMSDQANVLTIPRPLLDLTGSLECALLLSQIIYWSDRAKEPGDWFYKTYADWTAELGLSEYQVRKSVRHLVGLGVLETSVRRTRNGTPTCHYRLDWPKFSETILHFFQNGNQKKCRMETEESAETLNTEPTPEPTDIKEEGAGAPASPTPSVQETKDQGSKAAAQARPVKQPKHPAVEAYRAVTGRYPPKETEPLITEAGIETASELQFWESVIRRFIGCGWNPQNIDGMLDYYQRRELPTTRPNPLSPKRRPHEKNLYPASNQAYRFATPADFGLLPRSDPDG